MEDASEQQRSVMPDKATHGRPDKRRHVSEMQRDVERGSPPKNMQIHEVEECEGERGTGQQHEKRERTKGASGSPTGAYALCTKRTLR